MIRLRARVIAGAAALACGAAAADACFPDYQVGSSGDGGQDSTTADASEGSTADGTSGDEDTGSVDSHPSAESGGGDGGPEGDAHPTDSPAPPDDAGPLTNVSYIEAGTFYGRVKKFVSLPLAFS